jgi:hypothetical protein
VTGPIEIPIGWYISHNLVSTGEIPNSYSTAGLPTKEEFRKADNNEMEDSSHEITRQQLLWATVAAVLFVVAAAVIVILLFGWPSLSNSDGLFTIAVLLSVALVGWVSWLGVERYSSAHPILGGVAAGIFTGIFAHPLA